MRADAQSWHSSPECPVLSFSTAASAPTWPCAPGAAGMSKSGGQAPTSFRACASHREAPRQAAHGMDTPPLLAGLLFQVSPSALSSLLPWRLCLSSCMVQRTAPAWHVVPDLPGGSFPAHFVAFQHLSALLCWGLLSFLPGVTPRSHTPTASVPCRPRCAARAGDRAGSGGRNRAQDPGRRRRGV